VTGPVSPDLTTLERRLATMRRAIGQLEALGPLRGARLTSDTTTGLVVERILALLLDLAVAINREALGASAAAGTGAASFAEAGAAGLISRDVAAALTPDDGPHHVLLQLTLDVEPDEAAAIVAAALAAYQEYVRQVSRWLVTDAG
jgi:hypothetical protein